jgi:multicomponent Na+:H+ antiporter subunit C
MMEWLGLYHYLVFPLLLMSGIYAVIAKRNLFKKLIGLSLMQSAVFLLYITMAKVEGGTGPILKPGDEDVLYSNPLPEVLILTAIVVGISTAALGLGIIVRIKEEFGSVEEDVVRELGGR